MDTNARTPILVFGDSHAITIRGAAKKLKRTGLSFGPTNGRSLLRPFASEKAGAVTVDFPRWELHPPYSTTLTPDRAYVFSGPFHTSRLARDPAWLKHCPLPIWERHPSSLPVTEDEIAALCDRSIGHMVRLLELASAHRIRIAVMESPRLLPRLRQHWKGDVSVVGEVDRLLRRHVRRRLEGMDIPIIDTPPQTYDGRWTRNEYAAVSETDVHHGNIDYGAAMLERIDAWVASGESPKPETETETEPRGWKTLFRR